MSSKVENKIPEPWKFRAGGSTSDAISESPESYLCSPFILGSCWDPFWLCIHFIHYIHIYPMIYLGHSRLCNILFVAGACCLVGGEGVRGYAVFMIYHICMRYTYIYKHIYICIQNHVYIYKYRYIYIYLYIYIYIYISIYLYIYACVIYLDIYI